MAGQKILTPSADGSVSGFFRATVSGQKSRPQGGLDTNKKDRDHEPEHPGRSLTEQSTYLKRLSRSITGGLAAVAEPGSRLHKAIRRSYYQCYAGLHQTEGTLKPTRACKVRGCPQCDSVRMSKLRQTYGPYVASWAKAFVTLTWPNCAATGEALAESLDRAEAALKAVRKRLRRAYPDAKAMLVTELTWNPLTSQFHPHIHVVTNSKDAAYLLMHAWLEVMEGTSRSAQSVRDADPSTVRELLKYTFKGVEGGKLVPFEVRAEMLKGLHKRNLHRTWGFSRKHADAFNEEQEGQQQDEGDGIADAGVPAFTREAEDLVWHWKDEAESYVAQDTGEVLVEIEWTPGRLRACGRTDEADDLEERMSSHSLITLRRFHDELPRQIRRMVSRENLRHGRIQRTPDGTMRKATRHLAAHHFGSRAGDPRHREHAEADQPPENRGV